MLADQPWEAEFMAKLGKRLQKVDHRIKLSLAFTDYYTSFSRIDFLTGFRAGFPGEIMTQSKLYQNWQLPIEEPSVDFKFLEAWESKYCRKRNLREIEKTNQWVYGQERLQWHLPISNAWKEKILEDTIRWCEDCVKNFNPSLIIAIERSTLPKNILYSISEYLNVPFLTIIPSRIGNRMTIRADFGYGVSDVFLNTVSENYKKDIDEHDVQRVLKSIIENAEGSYASLENRIATKFRERRSLKFTPLKKELRLWIGRVYTRIFIHLKARPFELLRVGEDFTKMSLVELRKIFVEHTYRMGFRFWGVTELPVSPYFFWALHMRPEGSVLVLGDGRDEIVELFRSADLIPDGYFLAVKENPEMFGLRRVGFYRKLRAHKKIILIDPFTPTFPLIQESLGVIGISGTVLLEAAILNVPSASLGKPEFDQFLCESGWESSGKFIEKCIKSEYENVREKIIPYISFILKNSSSEDIPYDGPLDTPKAEQMIDRFAHEILQMVK